VLRWLCALVIDKEGVRYCRPWTSVTPDRSNCSPDRADTEIGTSCNASSRRRAVTMMSDDAATGRDAGVSCPHAWPAAMAAVMTHDEIKAVRVRISRLPILIWIAPVIVGRFRLFLEL
jgi:hypothetical protein